MLTHWSIACASLVTSRLGSWDNFARKVLASRNECQKGSPSHSLRVYKTQQSNVEHRKIMWISKSFTSALSLTTGQVWAAVSTQLPPNYQTPGVNGDRRREPQPRSRFHYYEICDLCATYLTIPIQNSRVCCHMSCEGSFHLRIRREKCMNLCYISHHKSAAVNLYG